MDEGNKIDSEVGTGAELLAAAAERRFDVIILDVSLPDMNGLDVLKNIKASGKAGGVLVLSMHPEERYAARALKAGAGRKSPPTVATYRARVLEKLGLSSTVDLVRYALDHELVE